MRAWLGDGLNPGVRRREALAWAGYDFANSGFTTVVITAVYNAYFVAHVARDSASPTLLWTSALALSYLMIMLSAPLLGAYADARAAKKALLLACTFGCVLGTAALGWVGPGHLGWAIALLVFANFCYGSGENLAAAFLPELARPERYGWLSGFAWAVGYLGGLLVLALCLLWVHGRQSAGAGPEEYVPGTLWITAGAFALAAAPLFVVLRERARPTASAAAAVRSAWRRVADTLRAARAHRDLFRFLGCIVCYQAGIQTVIALAAVYAQQALGFDTAQTLTLILVVNLTAALGAAGFGWIQDRLGHARTLRWTLLLWLLTTVLAWRAEGPASFWLVANLAGLGLGAAQSAGRALVAHLSPPDRLAEFFGLWGLAVKLASILGPLAYGLVAWASDENHRLAMLATGAFFVLGLLVLASVDLERGRRAALAARAVP